MQSAKRSVRNKAPSITTYGFPTLYTIIPQNWLQNVMRELINFCFKGVGKQYTAITKFGATWTDDENKLKEHFIKLPWN